MIREILRDWLGIVNYDVEDWDRKIKASEQRMSQNQRDNINNMLNQLMAQHNDESSLRDMTAMHLLAGGADPEKVWDLVNVVLAGRKK